MRHAILSSVTCLDLPYFQHYLINGTFSEKNKLWNIECVFQFSVQLLSETFLVLRRNQGDIIISVNWSSCKVPIILHILIEIDFSKNAQISISINIRPVGAELFHADMQVGRQECNFAKAPNGGFTRENKLLRVLPRISSDDI